MFAKKGFSQKTHLNGHIRVVHDGKRPYKCTLCNNTFTQSSHMKTHIKRVHLKSESYQCTICEQFYTTERYLQNHIETIHNKMKPHECLICHKTFSQKSTVNLHMKTVHEGERKHCSFCDKSFAAKRELGNHISKVHESNKSVSNILLQPKIGGGKASLMRNEQAGNELEKPKYKENEKTKDEPLQKEFNVHNYQNSCFICKKKFPKTYHLLVHNAICHSMVVVLNDIRA